MKLTKFIKKELSGWKKSEVIGLTSVPGLIIISALFVKDSPAAVISAVCGVLYTIIAGKGKVSCYIFGLAGSGCYSFLAYSSALYGNLALYLCYYIPMQILGFFSWGKNLKKNKQEIIKTKLNKKERLILFFISVSGCACTILLLAALKDSSPVIDGTTSFLSIIGMYLTVRRCIEQWILWMIVNGLSLIMWLNLAINGAKTFSTVIMWAVYLFLAVYFYIEWRKEERLPE